MAIWTKPLARRTLSRVRGPQFVWDDARARLQVIICVLHELTFQQNWQLAWPEGDEMAKRPLNPHTIIFI
jgi:hypothetical protein